MTRPITPPPELVQQWYDDARDVSVRRPEIEHMVATRAAQWGADAELEACCEWLRNRGVSLQIIEQLRTARRPKPPSLKERALQAWTVVEAGTDDQTAMAVIRRALEQLSDD